VQDKPATKAEQAVRRAIIEACRFMNASGLNQGTSGNVSVRSGAEMLITPSAIPYDRLRPEMIAAMPLGRGDGACRGPLKPSTEWRFHRDILAARPDVGAVVHAHPPHATALAIARRPIPPCHYMVAAFGGTDIRCAGYARYGTQALSDLAVAALEDRMGCLLANHGMIAVGPTLEKALWLAVELETLARQYCLSLAVGGPVLLSAAEIAEVKAAFAGYGLAAPKARPARTGAAGTKRRRQ
jgi:L-fuculose-phosphate aldolase